MKHLLLMACLLTECCTGVQMEEEGFQTLDCERHVEDGYLYAACDTSARAFLYRDKNYGPYQAVKITAYLKSEQPITVNTQLLTFNIFKGTVTKTSGSEETVWSLSKLNSLRYIIASYFYFQLSLVNVFNVELGCTNTTSVGFSRRQHCDFHSLNKTFLSSESSENNKTRLLSEGEVLKCFGPVNLLNAIVIPFANKEDYFRENSTPARLPNNALQLYKKIWTDDFGCVVDTLEINMGMPLFPKELLVPYLHNIPIRSLVFDGNNFGTFSDFPHIPQLTSLSLSKCGLSDIEPNAFQRIQSLRNLDLSHNNLKTIPVAFQNTPQLQNLFLQFNKLDLIDAHDVQWPPKLKTLNLAGNNLPTPFFPSFNSTPLLEVLTLRSCNVQEMSSTTFPMLRSLHVLDLGQNKLISINTSMFATLPQLRTLDLSNNQLKSFLRNTEEGLNQLLVLNLSNNAINAQNGHLAFQSAWDSLQTLDLSNNHLSSWNQSLFVNLTQLKFLDLTSNNITEWNPAIGRSLEALNSTTLKLRDNAFDCDSCDLLSFQEWLQENFHRLGEGPEYYVCRFPTDKFGLPLMEAMVNEEKCFPKPFDWKTNILLPLLVVICLVIVVGGVIYHYRGHIHYLIMFVNSKLRQHYNDLDFPFQYDAYLSYASEDLQWVADHMVAELEHTQPPVSLFIRDRDPLAGLQLVDTIAENLDTCRKCIFLLSKHFLADKFRTYELEIALRKLEVNYRDMILLVRLEPIHPSEVPTALQMLMRMRTYLDWPQDPNDTQARARFWWKLKRAIHGTTNPAVA